MLAFGEQSAVAAAATSTVSVALQEKGTIAALSVSSPTATPEELQVSSILVAGKPVGFSAGGAAQVPWAGIVNRNGTLWHVLDRPITVDAVANAVQVTVLNGDGAAADICVAVEYR